MDMSNLKGFKEKQMFNRFEVPFWHQKSHLLIRSKIWKSRDAVASKIRKDLLKSIVYTGWLKGIPTMGYNPYNQG